MTAKANTATPAISATETGPERGPAATNVGHYQRLVDIGIALSAERDHNRLMEMILLEAKELSNADGGTLYLRTAEDALRFVIMRNDTLNVAMGGTTGKEIPFPPLQMYDEDRNPNHNNVASSVALTGVTVNIPDAYKAKEYDFSGTRKFDEGTGYRSKSFLCVPLKNSQGDVIGVLQLLNARKPGTSDVIEFDHHIQPLIEALASQAAVALDNQMLLDAQKNLLESFIQMIAGAIDAKSPYTGGHCARVPELTKMLVAKADQSDDFPDFKLTPDDWEELHIAAWLHDCGKVTTPEYVVDKATKLETIYNRIHEVRTRFEVLKRDAVIDFLKARLAGGDKAELEAKLEQDIAEIDDDFAFVAECNVGGEFMAPDRMERLDKIAKRTWTRTLDDRAGISRDEERYLPKGPAPELPVKEPLLNDLPQHVIPWGDGEKEHLQQVFDRHGITMKLPDTRFNRGELYNLKIARGTLAEEERFKINEHIVQTIIMLSALPFPKHLARVPKYAGGHHEKLDGSGYPRGLVSEEMAIPEKVMAIADIFEALTAADRPYKPPKTLSQALKIMSFMKKDQHIDGPLFELFLRSGVYMDYAERFLNPEQLDAVNIEDYL